MITLPDLPHLANISEHTIVVLPLGAHEQHGPHLPFDTDTIIATGIAGRLAAACNEALDIRFLATEPVGYSVEHSDVTGTISHSYEQALSRWISMMEALSDMGVRRVLLLNAHGGNSPLLTIVATEARVRCKMLCVVTSWTRFGIPDGEIAPDAKAIDIHGGDIETSVMLAFAPDRVDMENAKNFPSRQSMFQTDFSHLRAYGPHAFGWMMHDLNDQGVAGNAARATALRGERLIAHAVSGLSTLLDDMAKFDLALFG